MTAGRASYGVLSQDNMNLGLSLGYGKTLDTMGYELRDPGAPADGACGTRLHLSQEPL